MSNSIEFLESAKKQFFYYKTLGDKTIAQLSDDELYWQYNEESNSVATIVKHMWGNMMSRWTDFLTTDGEKEWRKRDDEFEINGENRRAVEQMWEAGWKCLFDALDSINEQNSTTLIYIRNQGHTITEAISRQLCHYAYHTGQIVFIGKMLKGHEWETLSIAKGNSAAYNQNKFSQEKTKVHFTQEWVDKDAK
jgi:uncharacterized damage-inducible protein DinB